MIKAIIMAGGTGSRLWPLSRASHPKQFLFINKNKTMLQETLLRLSDINVSSNITVCNIEHRFFVAEQLKEIDQLNDIILEPISKNTAPAIALAAFQSIKSGEDPLLLVLPADHLIKNKKTFTKTITDSLKIAQEGFLVLFGIEPSSSHTGYGYIKKGDKYLNGFKIGQFVEKPNKQNAEQFIKTKKYLWNSGMFLFKASTYLNELKNFSPEIYKICKECIDKKSKDLDFTRIKKEIFEKCPSDSVDYAVMENTKKAIMVQMKTDWSDIGSWSSLAEITNKDKSGNSLIGDVSVKNTNNTFVLTQDNFVAAVGVSDLVIVSTKDAIMVAHKDFAQDVKMITEDLKKNSRNEWKFNREVYRPWGKFDSIDKGSGYQVKRISVNPGAKLSVQFHHHRSEHWVVVSGQAKVTKGKETFILKKNESTFIPLGEIHALENPLNEPLELIEVQSGDYLGEDDIVRIEDKYGREEDN